MPASTSTTIGVVDEFPVITTLSEFSAYPTIQMAAALPVFDMPVESLRPFETNGKTLPDGMVPRRRLYKFTAKSTRSGVEARGFLYFGGTRSLPLGSYGIGRITVRVLVDGASWGSSGWYGDSISMDIHYDRPDDYIEAARRAMNYFCPSHEILSLAPASMVEVHRVDAPWVDRVRMDAAARLRNNLTINSHPVLAETTVRHHRGPTNQPRVSGEVREDYRQLGAQVRAAIRALRADHSYDPIGCVPGAPEYDGMDAAYIVESVADFLLPVVQSYCLSRSGFPISRQVIGRVLTALNIAAINSPWCGSNEIMYRADCGHYVHSFQDLTRDHADRSYCQNCADRVLVVPEDDDEYHHRDDLTFFEYRYWVEPPREFHLRREGRELLNSWGSSTSHLAHDASFVPNQFGDFTMGVELEVEVPYDSDEDYDDEDDVPSRNEALVQCNTYFNATEPYAMFKRDGSLDDYRGFEIVTAARRLGDHIERFKSWEPSNLQAWDSGNCGMHVHIDSRAFSALTLGKFLMFFNDENNKTFIRSIAGRHPHMDAGAADYAATVDQDFVTNPREVKCTDDHHSRYRIVNLTNLGSREQTRLQCNVERHSKGDYSTVEIRIFRATLRRARLLAQIEFAHAAVAFCRVASWHDLSGNAFKKWLATAAGYPHLTRWFGVSKARNKRYLKAESGASQALEV